MYNKPITIAILWLGILTTGFTLLTQEAILRESNSQMVLKPVEDIKQKAFQILETKCNVCHRKKNPFMVFSLKNMEKRAPKIHKQVFIKRRMPKGNEIKLTNTEFATLKTWLETQNIY